MKPKPKIIGLSLITGIIIYAFLSTRPKNTKINHQPMDKIENQNQTQLPQPNQKGDLSLEEAISQRRSQRQFKNQSLELDQISQLVWAVQGITNQTSGFRSAPSAGALYPLEIYLVVGENGVNNLNSGVYHYRPKSHSLDLIVNQNVKSKLSQICLGQDSINQAPISIIITGVFKRTQDKYGNRGERYVYMEAGHAAQNAYLQSESLKLGMVVIGAFNDQNLIDTFQLPDNHQPIYVIPIGHPK